MNFLSITLLLTCAIASDHRRRSSYTWKYSSKMYGNKPVDGIDYSHLKSVEDVQKEAADAVKGFIKSMKDMPEEMLCGKKLFKKARSCNAQMYLCGELAEGVQEFLPLKSGRFQRMTQINESSLQHQTELGKISDLEHEKKKKDSSKKKKEKDSSKSNSDFTKYIDFRAQSIKDILGAIRNVTELVFQKALQIITISDRICYIP